MMIACMQSKSARAAPVSLVIFLVFACWHSFSDRPPLHKKTVIMEEQHKRWNRYLSDKIDSFPRSLSADDRAGVLLDGEIGSAPDASLRSDNLVAFTALGRLQTVGMILQNYRLQFSD